MGKPDLAPYKQLINPDNHTDRVNRNGIIFFGVLAIAVGTCLCSVLPQIAKSVQTLLGN